MTNCVCFIIRYFSRAVNMRLFAGAPHGMYPPDTAERKGRNDLSLRPSVKTRFHSDMSIFSIGGTSVPSENRSASSFAVIYALIASIAGTFLPPCITAKSASST